MHVETQYAAFGDANIAFQTVGDGDIDIAYIACWMSHLDRLWQEPRFARFIERLSTFGRVILFDKRGTGLSDPLSTSAPPSLEDRMDDLTTVLDAAGSRRTVLLGAGFGGRLAALFAATYPERVAGLMMVSASARGSWAEDYPLGRTREEIEEKLTYLTENWGGPVWIEAYAASAWQDPQFASWWAECLRSAAGPATAVAMHRLDAESDIRDVLPTITTPTLILHRTGDRVADVRESRYLAEHMPGSCYVELPGDDHLIFVGDQDPLFNEIGQFVTSRLDTVPVKQVLATVAAVEIDGIDEAQRRLGTEQWSQARTELRAEILALHAQYRGLTVMPRGEGFVAAFDGPARAIRFARDCAEAIRRHGLNSRIGLHSGQVAFTERHLGGIATDLASRVATLARSGELLITSTLLGLVSGSGLQFAMVENHDLSGVPGGMRIFRLRDKAEARALLNAAPAAPETAQVEELSPREHQVAVCVARGLSNREIGVELSISVSTVERHVANILGKLGFRSRTQVSAWAADQKRMPSQGVERSQPITAGQGHTTFAAD